MTECSFGTIDSTLKLWTK